MDRETVRRFREDLKVASPDERARKWGAYGAWLKEGAKAQGFVGQSGMVIMGVCAFCILLVAARGFGTIPLYIALGLGGLVGLAGAWIGARRERNWRRANPFKP